MVRTTKGGRELNPADAHRREERKKQNARNKLERKFNQEARSNRDKPEEIKKQLQEIIDLEQLGALNKVQKLRKKVLQDAYDQALKKKKEDEVKGAGSNRPEDSRYYHPILNPSGKPPPGKQAAALISTPVTAPAKPVVPLPKPPPLPAGPAPKLPPPPTAPPLPAGPAPTSLNAAAVASVVLPPPEGPPPGFPGSSLPAPLPPPAIPPPGFRLPPPSVPPPMPRLAPPSAPPPPIQQLQQQQQGAGPMAVDHPEQPPGMETAPQQPVMPGILQPPGVMQAGMLQPPAGLPYTGAAPQPATLTGAATATGAAKASATITGTSTVAKRTPAHMDKSLTSLVPASVLVRREQHKPQIARHVTKQADLGFGLAPIQRSNITSAPDPEAPFGLSTATTATAQATKPATAPSKPAAAISVDAQYQEFMATMKEMGAV